MPPSRAPPRGGRMSKSASSLGAQRGKLQKAEVDAPWELRTVEARRWGEQLRRGGGAGPRAVKGLSRTLLDSRSLSEVSLRRTTAQALLPAAEVGHRGALAAQAALLTDSSDTVRRAALASLRTAAGGRRPLLGGAVAVALGEALPPKDARYNADARRRGAEALLHLAPKGDPRMVAAATAWLEDDDAEVRLAAAEALGEISVGGESVEALASRLADRDARVSRAAVRSLERLVTGELRHARPEEERGEAEHGRKVASPDAGMRPTATAPAGLGAGACGSVAPALPMTRRPTAGTTLAPVAEPPGGSRPPSAQPSDEGEEERDPWKATAVEAFVRICGGVAADGEPPLVHGLARTDAVIALGRSARRGDAAALRAIMARLADADVEVRREALMALRALAPGQRATVTRMSAQLLADGDFRVRDAAAQALSALCADGDGDEEEGAGDLEESAYRMAAAQLERRDWRSRRGVGMALRRLAENAQRLEEEESFDDREPSDPTRMALDALLPRLHHSDWSVRRKAVQAIGTVAEAACGTTRAVELLHSAARDPDEDVVLAVLAALPGAAPRKCKQAVMLALRLAGSRGKGVKAPAPEPEASGTGAGSPPVGGSKAPSAFGGKAPSMAPSRARSKAPSKAASRAPPRGPATSPALAAILGGALSGGKPASEALPEVTEEEPEEPIVASPLEVRLKAITVVEDLAAEGRSRTRAAVLGLVELLLDPDLQVRHAAERALGTIGRGRRTALDELTKLLPHEDPQVRASVARAFKGVGTATLRERALLRMQPMLRHSDPEIRASVKAAIVAFTSSAEMEALAMDAAAGVIERFRSNRLPRAAGGSARGSRAPSESGRSAASNMSKMSKASNMSTGSKASKASKASGARSRAVAEAKAALAARAAAAGRSSSKTGSVAGSVGSRAGAASNAGRSEAARSVRSGASSKVSKTSKLSAMKSRQMDLATKAEREEREEQERLEREEVERVALMERLHRMENGPPEEEYSHSESDGDPADDDGSGPEDAAGAPPAPGPLDFTGRGGAFRAPM